MQTNAMLNTNELNIPLSILVGVTISFSSVLIAYRFMSS